MVCIYDIMELLSWKSIAWNHRIVSLTNKVSDEESNNVVQRQHIYTLLLAGYKSHQWSLYVTTKHGQNRGFSADGQKPQKSHYHQQNQNWFNRYINCKQRQKSWCYIWQCFKLRSFCELHLQICLVQFIQHQQKPKVSNNRCCQDPYPSLCDVQNRLLQQPVVRHPR